MNGYAIICDARNGRSLGVKFLALVDRSKTKTLWWTSDDPWLAIRYRSKKAASYACKRLRMNNPRVVDFDEMAAALQEQGICIVDALAAADMETGWDGHKH